MLRPSASQLSPCSCPLAPQLILSGDFHQLPPVAKGRDAAAQVGSECSGKPQQLGNAAQPALTHAHQTHCHPTCQHPSLQRKFCFEAESWGRCIAECCFLSKVFRQV